MKVLKPLVIAATVVLSAILAYGVFTRPNAKPADYDGFSGERVLQDLEVISRDHHSVAHPVERAAVREYLIGRLEELGADTVKVFRYDSLRGPFKKHVTYTFDAYDVLAEFAPASGAEDCTWLMFVAHYDSRYSQPMPKRDTVWSYGAADDGYGLGVTLETMRNLVGDRANWNQGVKVLFTDAEEPELNGMTAIWENNREQFDNVGLVINLEARGPWGPCLLFETCPGNSRVMDLYARCAKSPFTYSLTTVVYRIMPNFTDFTLVKDHIPGLNFSTITDVNHYHTHLDNFSNVSAKTIQHYGAQVLPVASEYVHNPKYADKDYLRSDSDTVNFTIPGLGLVNMSKTWYLVLNIVVFLLFILLLVLELRRGGAKFTGVLGKAGLILGVALLVFVFGEFAAWVCAKIAGARFVLFGVTQGIMFDNAAMIVLTVLLAVGTLLVYWKTGRKHRSEVLLGALLLDFVLSAALLFALGENLMFLIPLGCAVAALLLGCLTGWKFWIPVAMAVILLHAFSFLHALAMALTIGAYGAVAMIAFIDLVLLIPLADEYLS